MIPILWFLLCFFPRDRLRQNWNNQCRASLIKINCRTRANTWIVFIHTAWRYRNYLVSNFGLVQITRYPRNHSFQFSALNNLFFPKNLFFVFITNIFCIRVYIKVSCSLFIGEVNLFCIRVYIKVSCSLFIGEVNY